MRRYLLLLWLVLTFLSTNAQKLTVESFSVKTNDLSASTHERKDLNGNSCALVKVQLATSGAQFSPNVVGNVEYKVNEYWVYLPTMNKHMEVKHPSFLTKDVVFADYGVKLEPKTTYSLVLQSSENNAKGITPFVKGIPIKMVYVEGGNLSKDGGQTSQKVESFYMSQTEVTVSLWNAVMSDRTEDQPSSLPKTDVSWSYCHDFIEKLNQFTGLSFRMPTETEWEYAARGGRYGHGYKYSGSNDLNSVACYGQTNGPDIVAQMKSNELGIYDMSGNVWEWCNNKCNGDIVHNPKELDYHDEVVVRGGGWFSKPHHCTIASRACQKVTGNYDFIGLRLVMDDAASKDGGSGELKCDVVDYADSIVLKINDFRIPFQYVEAGTFKMGGTAEQKEFAAPDEFPVHKVSLDGFYISKEKLSIPEHVCKKLGIRTKYNQFTYEQAQTLIKAIAKASQLKLSLPTEAEWEYAARGGTRSKGYMYSGTNDANCHEGPMTANELGLIGMSEGDSEWTADTYSQYMGKPQNNPHVSEGSDYIAVRGGQNRYYNRRRLSGRIQGSADDNFSIRLVLRK